MFNFESSPIVTNCTFTSNSAEYEGGGIYNEYDSSPTVTNCILWGNIAPNGPQIYNYYSSDPNITYSNVQGGYAGTGNINADPLFIRNPGPGDFGDLRLQVDSPCIDTGDNNSVPLDLLDIDGDGNTTEPIPFDLANRPRIMDGNGDSQAIVDMGAYERQCVMGPNGDLNDDCGVDFPDFVLFARNWLETNCEAANNWCEGADIGKNGEVGLTDLAEMIENWLEGL